jgi:hypothetical protein
MRRATVPRFSQFCHTFVCSCGAHISGCREHHRAPEIIVPEGCHRCFDRWMARRIRQAEIAAFGPLEARGMPNTFTVANHILELPGGEQILEAIGEAVREMERETAA